MVMTKTLRSIVTEQKLPALGTADDGKTITDACRWLANQGRTRTEPVELDLEGERWVCETTVTVRDFDDFTFGTKSGGTIQSNKDWGIFATADEARNRCHLLFRAGNRAKVGHPLTITGPHSDAESNKSPGYVLEQQCGIWFQSVTEVEAIGQNIDHVWGDFIDIGFAADDPRRTTKAMIIPGTWNRCGRVAFNSGGTASGVEFAGDGSATSSIARCPGDIYHVEIQGAGGFRDHNVHDLVVQGQPFRAHLTGMNFCSDVRIHNILATEMYVMVNPATGQRAERVFIQDNHWTAPGGGLCDLYKIDGVVVTGNVGPYPKRLPQLRTDGTDAVIACHSCSNVIGQPNTLTGV